MMDSGPERMMEIDWNLAHFILLGKNWLKGRSVHLVGLYISIGIKQKNIYYLFVLHLLLPTTVPPSSESFHTHFFFSSLLPKDTLISSPPTDHAADKTQPATAPSPVPHGSLSPSLSNTSNPETTLNIHHLCQQASTFVFWPTFIIFSTVGSSGCIPQPLQQLQP
jgi:hypothetical protein